MYEWPHSDLVAAVASVVLEAEKCPGCGLTENDAWWVAAEPVMCPTCEDRDRINESLRKEKSTAGVRVRFTQLADVESSMLDSSASRYTLEGARKRAEWRRQHR